MKECTENINCTEPKVCSTEGKCVCPDGYFLKNENCTGKSEAFIPCLRPRVVFTLVKSEFFVYTDFQQIFFPPLEMTMFRSLCVYFDLSLQPKWFLCKKKGPPLKPLLFCLLHGQFAEDKTIRNDSSSSHGEHMSEIIIDFSHS